LITGPACAGVRTQKEESDRDYGMVGPGSKPPRDQVIVAQYSERLEALYRE
jgi:hypothetical protein